MKIWLDAQLPPALARWIQEQPSDIQAVAVLKQVLSTTLPQALELLRQGEPCVEIRPRQTGST